MKKSILFLLLFATAQFATGQNLGIFDEVIAKDSQRVSGDWISGIVSDSASIASGSISKLVSAPGVVDYINKRLAGIGGGGGGSNNITFAIVGDSLAITDAGGTLKVAISDIAPIQSELQDLNDVLTLDNSAGANGINMNGNNVTGLAVDPLDIGWNGLQEAAPKDAVWDYVSGLSATDDQTALEVSFTPTGNIAATDVQNALAELDAEKLSAEVDGSVTNELQTLDVSQLVGTNLELSLSSDGEATKVIDLSSLQDGTGTDDQTAAEVPNTPAGNISATNVQAAINELDAEKLSVEVDGSTTNELNTSVTMAAGSLAVTDAGGAKSVSLISTDGGNTINVGSDGKLYSAAGAGESTTVSDTDDIDMTLTGSDITATVKIDVAGDNILTKSVAGLKATEVDGSVTNELQTLDVSQLTGTNLELSLSNDGEATKVIDLSSLQDGTGTDDQTAAEVPNTPAGNIAATNVQAAINELDAEKLSVEVDGSVTNELQTIDVSQLVGTNLELSLSNDGEATKVIDLSSLQDGTGTDDQTATEVAFSPTGNIAATNVQAALAELDTEKLSVEVDGSVTNEIQTLDVSQLVGTNLELSLSLDGEATKVIDLSSLQDGTGTDDQTAAEVAFSPTGNIAATNVQAALAELDTEKLSVEVDGSVTNELQTLSNTSNATTHTVTLSNSGGSLQLAEGANITLTTTGTGADGVVTIASTGGGASVTNTSVTVIGENQKVLTITDSQANTVVDTFPDRGSIVYPEVTYLSPDALIQNDTFDALVSIGINNDFAISPKIINCPVTGRFYEVFRTSSTHLQGSTMLGHIRSSTDGGETWSSVTNIPNVRGANLIDWGSGAVTPTGRLVLFGREFTTGGAFVGSVYAWSDDYGATLSTILEFSAANFNGYFYDNKFMLGESGELVFGRRTIETNRYIKYYQSFDNGETWSLRSTAFDNTVSGWNFGEINTIDFGEGLWVAFSRLTDTVFTNKHFPFVILSQDYGRNWAGNSETISANDILSNNFGAGFLKVEGIDRTLGGVSANESCLGWIEKVKQNGKRYLLVSYYIRYRDGAPAEDWKMTVFDIDRWITEGQSAIDTTIFQQFFQGSTWSINTPDGNGNFVLSKDGKNGIWTTADNVGTSSAGPSEIIRGRLPQGFIENLIDSYETKKERISFTQIYNTSPVTAQKYRYLLIDCSGGPITVNPPPASEMGPGDWFRVIDVGKNAATNTITIDFVSAGYTLHGVSENSIISANGRGREFAWTGTTYLVTNAN